MTLASGVTLTLGSPSAIAGVLAVVRLGKGGISRSVRDRQTCFSSSRHLRAHGIETEPFVSAGPLVSSRRGRPSNNRLPAAVRELAVAIVRERYADFGPTLACEKLSQRHGCRVSRETLRQ